MNITGLIYDRTEFCIIWCLRFWQVSNANLDEVSTLSSAWTIIVSSVLAVISRWVMEIRFSLLFKFFHWWFLLWLANLSINISGFDLNQFLPQHSFETSLNQFVPPWPPHHIFPSVSLPRVLDLHLRHVSIIPIRFVFLLIMKWL